MKAIRSLFPGGILIGIFFLVHTLSVGIQAGSCGEEPDGGVLWQSVPPALASGLIIGSLFGYASAPLLGRRQERAASCGKNSSDRQKIGISR